MSKKVLRSPLKVLAATSVTIFSLLTVFTSTAAWFDSRRALDNGGENFEVQNLSLDFSSLTLYRASAMSRTDMYFALTEDSYIEKITVNESTGELEKENDISSLQMGEYTLLDPHHPILMLIEYKETLTASVDHQRKVIAETNPLDRIYLGSAGDLSSQKIKQDSNTFPLSSVVRSYSTSYSTTWDGIPLTTYNGQNNLLRYGFNELETGSQFQRKDFAHFQHTQGSRYATYNGFDNRIDLFSASSGSIRTVAIVFDFHSDSLEYIYNEHVGDLILNDTIYFQCDWRTIV